MPDFLNKFADKTDETGKLAFSNWKSGLIVALACPNTPRN
jgi:SP family sugar:H+ symporter-like MFS transporter